MMSLVLIFVLLAVRHTSKELELRKLNIRTASYYFLMIASLFVRPKASGWAHVTWSWHKLRHAKSKLTWNEAFTVNLLQ